jgi:RHS repeat-associated protein
LKTGTWTLTPTITQTPTVTPDFTPTTTGSPTTTATSILTGEPQLPTETPVPPLQNAHYTYDGDGNMVKSVVNGVTTYYPSAQYQQEVNPAGGGAGGSTTSVQKTYVFGSLTVAVRTVSGSQNVLNWVVTDQISSTTVTASATGDLNSEIRYTAFGTIRYENGITPTDYRYTGQLQQAVIGLDYYNARWYDPQLGRFVQADTVIANANDPISYDRYAYVNNNPINHNDPTGHATCDDMGNCYLRPGESIPHQSSLLPTITIHYIPISSTTTSSGATTIVYNGKKAARWAVDNQKATMDCWSGTSCTCFASSAIDVGLNYELIQPGTVEYNRTPDFYNLLTNVYHVPSEVFVDDESVTHNLNSDRWKNWLKSHMPQPGDVILYHNSSHWASVNHAAVIVGFDSANGWPLVVDQGNGDPYKPEPHRIDSVNSTDITDIVLIYMTKWDGK